MSRTYRKRQETKKVSNHERWLLADSFVLDDLLKLDLTQFEKIYPANHFGHSVYLWYDVVYKRDSKHGKKKLARYHSDACTWNHKEPGPRAWKNLTAIRPYRRKYKEQCRKTLYDDDFEVVLEKIVYPYWT